MSLLFVPAKAEETINDLKKIYNNLQAHLHIPYYQDSEKYPAYSQMMEEIKALLASDAITQAEITRYYNDLRTVYSDLMRDTYGYSSLEGLLVAFDSLDSSIFSADSWKKLLSVRDSAQKELRAPTLFSRNGEVTEKQYTEYTQSHIETFSADFSEAFNSLELLEKPTPITTEYLAGYKAYVQFCSRQEVFTNTALWENLQNALEISAEVLEDQNATQTQLEAAYLNLYSAYSAACQDAFSFKTSNQILSEYNQLSAENYSQASWTRYSEEINLLKEKTTKIPYFFIPVGADKETCKTYTEKYQNSLAGNTKKLQNILVPIETYNKLQSLCSEYKNLTAIEGVEIKLSYLNSMVNEGEKVLNNSLSSLSDFENAIEKITAAKDDLDLAEKFLLEEQGKVLKQDTPTARIILILTVAILILSFVAAVFLSRHYFGKVNWRR